MCVLEKTPRSITVRLTNARWKRLMELETAYRMAMAVAKAKRECEAAPAMSVSEAMDFIDTL